MRLWRTIAVLGVLGGGACLYAGAQTQSGDGAGQQPGAAPAQRFPFPEGEKPAQQKATDQTQAPAATNVPAVQGASPTTPATPGAAPAQRFPFPEEEKPAAPKASAPNAAPGAGRFPFPEDDSPSSSSSSSSSSSGTGSGIDDAADAASTKPVSKKNGRVAAEKVQSVDDRVTEDLDVARFYRNGGNYKGAYLRAKDAIDHMPDDAEVNFVYAQATEKMGNKQDAVDHYRAYLKMDPHGDYVKQAEMALQQLIQ